MNAEKKIEMICAFYDCDFINHFYSYYFDILTIKNGLSPENFFNLMTKYGIKKKELVDKGVEISKLEHINDYQGLLDFQVRKQIDKIGTTEKKNKNGKTYSYVRNPGTLHTKTLLELLPNPLHIPTPPFASLETALTLSTGSIIVQFLQEKMIIDNGVLCFKSIEKLKESLQKLPVSELDKLLKRLQSSDSIDNDADVDPSAYFYEQSPLENLLLLKRILQIVELSELEKFEKEDILQSICIL